jgi:hypothetical protein
VHNVAMRDFEKALLATEAGRPATKKVEAAFTD